MSSRKRQKRAMMAAAASRRGATSRNVGAAGVLLRAAAASPLSPELLAYRKALGAGGCLILFSVFLPLSPILHIAALAFTLVFNGTVMVLALGSGLAADSTVRKLSARRRQLRSVLDQTIAKRASAVADLNALAARNAAAAAELQSELDEQLLCQTRLRSGLHKYELACEARKARLLSMAGNRRQRLKQMQDEELQELIDSCGLKVAELKSELKKLEEGEAAELLCELAEAQAKAKDEFLEHYSIEQGRIIGVSAATLAMLSCKGIISAFHLSQTALAQAGLSPALIKTLLAWKTYLEQQAELKKPVLLNKPLRRKIKNKYGKPRLKIESEILELESSFQRELLEVKELYQIAASRLEVVERELEQGAPAGDESESNLACQLAAVSLRCDRLRERLKEQGASGQEQMSRQEWRVAHAQRAVEHVDAELAKIVLPSGLDYLGRILGITCSF